MAETTGTSARPGAPAPDAVASGGLTLLALATAGLVVSVMQTLVLPLLLVIAHTTLPSLHGYVLSFLAAALAGAASAAVAAGHALRHRTP
jgi:hypothetical protein